MTTIIESARFAARHRGAILFAAVALAGCGEAGIPRAGIAGQVTVKGKPLAAGRIVFVPQEPTVGPAASATVKDGAYALPAQDGPVVGKNRVLVEADLPLGFAIDDEAAFAKRGGKPLPPQPIPPQYNSKSTLFVEVAAGDGNKYDVTVP